MHENENSSSADSETPKAASTVAEVAESFDDSIEKAFTAAATEAPKKKGRPAGAKDKRPRARKEGAQAAPQAPKKPKPTSPLAGTVDGDGAKEPGKTGPRVKSAEDLFALPAHELSSMAVSMLNMVVYSQVAKRVNGAAAQEAALTTAEQEKIEKATTRVLEKYLPHLSCEWALALTVCIIYTNKWSNIKLAAAGITQEQAFEMARQHAEALRQQADARAAGASAGSGAA